MKLSSVPFQILYIVNPMTTVEILLKLLCALVSLKITFLDLGDWIGLGNGGRGSKACRAGTS